MTSVDKVWAEKYCPNIEIAPKKQEIARFLLCPQEKLPNSAFGIFLAS